MVVELLIERLHKNDNKHVCATHKRYLESFCCAVDVEREKYFRGGFASILLRHETSSTRLDVIDGNNVVAV